MVDSGAELPTPNNMLRQQHSRMPLRNRSVSAHKKQVLPLLQRVAALPPAPTVASISSAAPLFGTGVAAPAGTVTTAAAAVLPLFSATTTTTAPPSAAVNGAPGATMVPSVSGSAPLAFGGPQAVASTTTTTLPIFGGAAPAAATRFKCSCRPTTKMRRLVSPLSCALFGSLFSLLTVVGLLGNLLVMVAIVGDRKMRKSVMNLLLLNLAIADALNLLAASVEWLPTILQGYPAWIMPAAMCPLTRYLECVFLFTSILTQLIVCVERYIAITLPLHARRLCSRRNIIATILVIWAGVALAALPYALHNEIRPNSSSCVNVHAGSDFWHKYKLFEFLSLYVLPCVIFIVLYSRICTVLWAKNRQLYEEAHKEQQQQQKSANGSLSLPSAAADSGRKLSSSAVLLSAREEALRTRRSVVKMLVACVSVYFICYSPIQAIFLSRGLFNVRIHPPYEFILLMNALAMLCSACNPLLYTLFSRRFRTRIARLLCCCGLCPACARMRQKCAAHQDMADNTTAAQVPSPRQTTTLKLRNSAVYSSVLERGGAEAQHLTNGNGLAHTSSTNLDEQNEGRG